MKGSLLKQGNKLTHTRGASARELSWSGCSPDCRSDSLGRRSLKVEERESLSAGPLELEQHAAVVREVGQDDRVHSALVAVAEGDLDPVPAVAEHLALEGEDEVVEAMAWSDEGIVEVEVDRLIVQAQQVVGDLEVLQEVEHVHQVGWRRSLGAESWR